MTRRFSLRIKQLIKRKGGLIGLPSFVAISQDEKRLSWDKSHWSKMREVLTQRKIS